MKKREVQNTWELMKRKLQQQYTILDDGDLQYIEGQELQLLQRIKGKLGLPMKDVKKIISRL